MSTKCSAVGQGRARRQHASEGGQEQCGLLDQSSANPVWTGTHLAVDPSGRAVVSSEFTGNADFDSVGMLTSAGGFDSVVLRFDAQGRLIGGGRWGGADDDVAVDAAGNAVIAGWTVPPVGVNGVSQSSARYAIFVAKLGW